MYYGMQFNLDYLGELTYLLVSYNNIQVMTMFMKMK